MHGGNAFLLIFVVLLVLNVPTFIKALLGTKCSLYLFPKLKRFFIIRWVLPVIFASILMLFGVGFAFSIWTTRGQPNRFSRVGGAWESLVSLTSDCFSFWSG